MKYIDSKLLTAVLNNDLKLANKYIQMGASVNIEDVCHNTLLDIAVKHEVVEMCELLLKNNADPNMKNFYGESALHCAAQYNKSDLCVKKLIEYGSNVDILDRKRQTPLHIAVSKQNLKIVEALINAKANINARDIDHISPLYLGVVKNVNLDIIDVLVKNGADFRCTTILTGSPHQISKGDIRKYFDNYSKEQAKEERVQNDLKIKPVNINKKSEDVSSQER